MEKKRIEEIRKTLNIDDGLQFGFAEDLVLWIIGGFGPVDMQPDGIKFEYVPLSDFPNGGKALLHYITACDAAEGFSVYRFKSPVFAGRHVKEVNIYLIQCTNNGTSYFASANLDALRSFVLCANEEIRDNRLKNIK